MVGGMGGLVQTSVRVFMVEKRSRCRLMISYTSSAVFHLAPPALFDTFSLSGGKDDGASTVASKSERKSCGRTCRDTALLLGRVAGSGTSRSTRTSSSTRRHEYERIRSKYR